MLSNSVIDKIKELILAHENHISPHYLNKEVEIIKIHPKDGNLVIKYKILHSSKLDSKWAKWYEKEMYINKEDSIRLIREDKLNVILH